MKNQKTKLAVGMMLVATVAAATGLLGSVSAQVQPDYCSEMDGTFHCSSTYDNALGGDILTVREGCGSSDLMIPDGSCPTDDGYIDMGGIIYDGCLSAAHAANGGDSPRDWPDCAGLGAVESVYIHDNFWGPADGPTPVGGTYCNDVNDDGLCGDPDAGEFFVTFCGHVDGLPVDGSTAFALVYFIDSVLFQNFDCGTVIIDETAVPPATVIPAANPIGGTSGTLSIWITPNTV